MSGWVIFGIFAGGYIARHLAGKLYDRVFPKSASGEPIVLDPSEVKDSVISYDRGKTWHIRTKAGAWVKVNYQTIQKILDFYVSNTNQPATDNQHPDAASPAEGKRK